MISTYRFASIEVVHTGGLRVVVRGKPGESVPLLVARRAASFRVVTVQVTVGAVGDAVVEL